MGSCANAQEFFTSVSWIDKLSVVNEGDFCYFGYVNSEGKFVKCPACLGEIKDGINGSHQADIVYHADSQIDFSKVRSLQVYFSSSGRWVTFLVKYACKEILG